MALSVQQLMSAGRARLVEREPYLVTAIMSVVTIEKPGMMRGKGWGVAGTVAPFAITDGWVMYYDPEVIQHWINTESNAAVICEWLSMFMAHELGHVLRDHGARQRVGMFHPRKFNRSCDFEINDDILAAGYKSPPDFPGLNPETDPFIPKESRKAGLTAEEYYYLDTWEPGDDEEGMCAGGSGAGSPMEGESDDEADAKSPQQSNNIKKQTAAAIQKAASSGRGEVPGGWARWAEGELKPPVISWQDQLRMGICTAVEYVRGMVELSYTRPSRRQATWGYSYTSPIMPGWRAPKPSVMIVIDTSGSMGEEELSRSVSEVKGILDHMDVDVTLMTNDADIHGPVQKISSVSEIALHGGGGTDFRPPFQYIKDKMDPKPSICVFITDGMGPAHMDPPIPDMQTIWVGVGPHRQRPWGCSVNDDGYEPTKPVSWGEYIEVVEPGEEEKGDAGHYGEDV